jgi:integrase
MAINTPDLSNLSKILSIQEKELLKSLTTIRKELMILNGEKLFRLYINSYTKKPTYYAHLFDDDGKQTDARMSCKTTDKTKAEIYAMENRKSFLEKYYYNKNKTDFYELLTNYYNNSPLLIKALKRRKIRNTQIIKYKSFIDNYYIPFLKSKNITTIEKANTLDIIEKFQEYCQNENMNELHHHLSIKTLNNNISCAVAPIFNQLLENKSAFILNYRLLEKEDRKSIGTIPIQTTLKTLLDDYIWERKEGTEKLPYLTNHLKHLSNFRLLCLLGNLCGLRNAEIYMLRKKNIIKIGNTLFLNIENSRIDGTGTKTKAGKRLIPLHPIVYKHLTKYINENNRTDYIFYNGGKNISYSQFNRARDIFTLLCGYDKDYVKEHNIVFYSFRHFFKTMLQNALPEKEYIEYLMGHTNKNDMSKNYLHYDSIGNKYLEENGNKIIKCINDYYKNFNQNIIVEQKEEYSIKEIVYKDSGKYKAIPKKYLIHTIKNTEQVVDILEEDIYDELDDDMITTF